MDTNRTARRRVARAATLAVAALALVGCSSRAVPAGAAGAAPANGASSPAPVAIPAATAAPASTANADTAGGCGISTQSFVPPSDTLLSVSISSGGGSDRIVFHFGPLSGEPLEPAGSIQTAHPPFTEGQSTNTVDVSGDDFVQIRFEGMLIADKNGHETFSGSTHRNPNLPALRELVETDASEGVVVWIAGYNGGGCVHVAVSEKGGTVTVTFEHA
ncbi:MAG: hypothetical protein ACJ77B_10290 [Chloroflexota bacterium]